MSGYHQLDLIPPPIGEWGREAICTSTDPELFHAEKGEADKTKAAKNVCRECPVIAECRSYALTNKLTFGVWGGMAPQERAQVYKGSPLPPLLTPAVRAVATPPPEHGAYARFSQHRRENETPCAPCQAARNEYARDRRKKERTSA